MLKDSPVIGVSADIMSGTLVFSVTRVPIQTFLDYLMADDSIDDFSDGFPTVSREQAIALLSDCFARTV